MMVSNDSNFKDAKWQPYKTRTFWQLSEGDGEKKIYVKFRDLVGNESKSVADDIILDTKDPFDISIILNKGQEATNNFDGVVLAQVRAKEAILMQVSNTADYRNARWIGYTELNFDWKLAGGDGDKVVYVRFQDKAGNISESVSDKIRLDRRPPYAGSVVINDGAAITNNSDKKVQLNLHAEGAVEMRISNDFRFTNSEWGTL